MSKDLDTPTVRCQLKRQPASAAEVTRPPPWERERGAVREAVREAARGVYGKDGQRRIVEPRFIDWG